MCISTLRLIRPASEAPTKEVIKEYFRLIGCLFCDKPVYSLPEMQAALREDDAEYDIVLKLDSSLFEIEERLETISPEAAAGQAFTIDMVRLAGRKNPTVFVNYEVPAVGKKAFYRDLISRLVLQIWGSAKDVPSAHVSQLLEIKDLFFDLCLLGFLQYKRSFRVVNMGEVLELSIGRQTIPASDYIGDMLSAFDRFYRALSEIKSRYEKDVSVYVRYASVNIARKIREVFNLLDGLPAAREEGAAEPLSVTYCSTEFLLSELGELYRQEKGYLGTLFLAAYVCQGEPSQEQNAGFYYRQLFEKLLRGNEQRAYSFAYYEYGRYTEKVEKNRSRAYLYYHKAAALDTLGYQARFKIGCYQAKDGAFAEARSTFAEVIQIISMGFSGDAETAWENLSLKSIQYLYKAYIWLWKLSAADNNYSEAMMYLYKAQEAAAAYLGGGCLKNAYDDASPEWEAFKNYHEAGKPVEILQKLAASRLENYSR